MNRSAGVSMSQSRSTEQSDFSSLKQVEELVDGFETTRLPQDQWNHRAHLTVAAWYATRYPPAEAKERMTEGIQRYNLVHDIRQTEMGGYNETMTIFWLTAVSVELRQSEVPNLLHRINGLVARFAQHKDLLFQFYDRHRIFSDLAHHYWVPPDRLPKGDLLDLSEALAAISA